MRKVDVSYCNELNENVYSTVLDSGLKVYICKKEGYKRKIGMFGTKYGSLTNHFIDINTQKEVIVPDGIAHFLEHKLFEKEGENSLDLFSKIGVNSNAYTSYDHTVYYFDTTKDETKPIKLLINLIKEPYFTDENVEKEKGIISQEIMMYEDDPSYEVFFNAIGAMYQKNNIKVDILGTVDSVSKITKEQLYTCYNTFYNLHNMFFIVVGDVDVNKTFDLIEKEIAKYDNNINNKEIKRFIEEEPESIDKKRVEKKMNVFMPQICIGFKLVPKKGIDIIKRSIITDIIFDMYFSKITNFYETEYNNNVLMDTINLSYEAEESFSHLLFIGESTKINKLEHDLITYIDEIKNKEINEELFNRVKENKIASIVLNSDYISNSYRRIINSILTNTGVYDEIKIAHQITKKDVSDFLDELKSEKMVISIVDSK